MILFLVGLPGVGKTYWGKKIAFKLGWDFYDLDACIESQCDLKIHQIIQNEGIEEFRRLEHDQLLKLVIAVASKNSVIACGGGTPVYKNGLSILKQHGVVTYLTDDLDKISSRLMKSDPTLRPTIETSTDEILNTSITKLLRSRRPFYEQSHIITSVSEDFNFHLFTNRLKLFTEQHIAGFK